jgi:hypothetical protein
VTTSRRTLTRSSPLSGLMSDNKSKNADAFFSSLRSDDLREEETISRQTKKR